MDRIVAPGMAPAGADARSLLLESHPEMSERTSSNPRHAPECAGENMFLGLILSSTASQSLYPLPRAVPMRSSTQSGE
jgi:hypothetical protein